MTGNVKIELDELESINLADELMIPTEQKEFREVENEEEGEFLEEIPNEKKIPLNEVISPEDSSTYLAEGIDAILGIVGTTFYSIKGFNLLTKQEKAIVKDAKRKPVHELSDNEKQLLEHYDSEKIRIQEKADAVELTERELAKLKKTSKAMCKVKNWQIGPEMAFYIVLVDILADRVIDAIMD